MTEQDSFWTNFTLNLIFLLLTSFSMRNLLFLSLLFFLVQARSQQFNTAKPWTYWWWMGSAVSEKGITRQLEQFAKAGIGGVHIIPIYGVKGYEKQFTPFLGKQWIHYFEHTTKEARRLGLGVDMTTGTGWPFGGANVSGDIAAKKWKLTGNKMETVLTGQAVKRAAPGGEGLSLDPFSSKAIPKYVGRFDTAFSTTTARPRAMYSDSYEVYGANWTDEFPAEFKKRRGYDLTDFLKEFTDSTQNERSRLIKMDYHQTIADLVLENFAEKWVNWSKKNHFITRYQAHGSPGNLLDLYSVADVPETESFGSSRFKIPFLRIDEDYEIERFGIPNPLAMKFASSAANLSGKNLVSSETCTWLANHFKVSLSQVKPQIDELFTAGINHVFFHGITYTAPEETFPGWLFYASTNFGPYSHFWKQMPELTRYIKNCQEILQSSKTDNDLLVYFPINDLWATSTKPLGSVYQLDIHSINGWILQQNFGKTCGSLLQKGFSLDYISDLQIEHLRLGKNGTLETKGQMYKAILIPKCTFLPQKTLESLLKLSKEGAKIVFEGALPEKFTGFDSFESRKNLFAEEITQLASNVTVSNNPLEVLSSWGLSQEVWVEKGLKFIRKKKGTQTVYFITNLSIEFNEGWIDLSFSPENPEKYSPLTQKSEGLPTQKSNGKTWIYLKLLPGESCFIRSSSHKRPPETIIAGTTALDLSNDWNVTFLEGMPSIKYSKNIHDLSSWVGFADSTDYFWGTVRYAKTFNLPEKLQKVSKLTLDLGNVKESALVKINGKVIGTAWCLPFQLEIPLNLLKPSNNLLEVEVSNLSANYMRLVDKVAPQWKKFYDINIVDIKYKPFDASKWQPMPSGLLGPVTIK